MLTGCDAMIQGLTTAAQKLQRKKILAKFQKEVDQAYGGK
jgi:long-subunit acyl-CoA synthetase (AMP-forming)